MIVTPFVAIGNCNFLRKGMRLYFKTYKNSLDLKLIWILNIQGNRLSLGYYYMYSVEHFFVEPKQFQLKVITENLYSKAKYTLWVI